MKRLACALSIVLLSAALTPGLFARAEEKAAEAALSNAEVVKLCKAGLGDGIVIAKVKEAPKTDFKLGTDDLIKLKQDGCSQGVIEAMLNRSAQSTASSSPKSGGSGGSTTVKLVTTAGETELSSMKGSHQTIMAFGVHNFCEYKEFAADTRTKERKVSVLIATSEGLEDRVWLVAVEQDEDDQDRSVPLVSAGPWGGRVADEPDGDAIVDCDIKQEKPGLWRLTPRKDLKPGEYGVYIVGGVLHDFGVDK